MTYDQWADQLSKKGSLQGDGGPKDLGWMNGFSEDSECDEEELPAAPEKKKVANPCFKFD
jgi:hypothetical protein